MIARLLVLVLCAFSCIARADSHLIAVASNLGFAGDPELRYAERDALAVRDVLQQFSGDPHLHTHELLGKQAEQLERTLKQLTIKPDDAVYIYYSGHADRDGLHLGNTLLGFDALKDAVEALPARVKLLIVDACRAGGITRSKGARPVAPFSIAIEDRLKIAGTAIVTSSAESEDSQESEDLGASFFTFHFLQALRGAADRDQDRLVTLNEAFGYAARQTLRSTALTDRLQHPMFKGKLFGQGAELVLSRLTRPSAAAVITLPGPGLYLVFDENDELFAEVTVEASRSQYVIPAGKWLVQKRLSGGAEEQWVVLQAGDERTIVASDATVVRLTRLDAKGRTDLGLQRRLHVLGGASAVAIEGHAPLPALWLGYRHMLSPLELVADLTFARGFSTDEAYGLRVHIDYPITVSRVRLALGLALSTSLHRQREPQRATQVYAGMGALASAEVKVSGALAVRIEAGPVVSLVKLRTDNRTHLAAPFGYWLAAGPTWGF